MVPKKKKKSQVKPQIDTLILNPVLLIEQSAFVLSWLERGPLADPPQPHTWLRPTGELKGLRSNLCVFTAPGTRPPCWTSRALPSELQAPPPQPGCAGDRGATPPGSTLRQPDAATEESTRSWGRPRATLTHTGFPVGAHLPVRKDA